MSMIQVNLLHICIISPLLIYIGVKGNNTKDLAYSALLTISWMIPFIIRIPSLKFNQKRDYINFIHLLIIPICGSLIYYKKKSLPDGIYIVLISLGILVILIHIYLLFIKLKN
jgi:hypothetical protein